MLLLLYDCITENTLFLVWVKLLETICMMNSDEIDAVLFNLGRSIIMTDCSFRVGYFLS